MHMNKNKRKILNPKYRFSKFNNKWEYCGLGSIANKVTKKNTLGKITRVLTNSASEGIVDQGDYFERTIVNQNNIKNYFIIKQGDFVYNPRISSIAPVGPISRNNIGDGIISPLYTVFRFNNKNNNFYEQYYKTSLWHKYLKEISNQGARFDRMSILDEDFFNMPIPYNKDSEELQEIANSIISIDNLILLEEEKLEELKSHKNGLLQKLFPQDNKCMPELRFKRYNQKWEKMTFDNLLDYERPEKYIVESTNYESSGTPVLTANKAFILGYSSEKFGIYKNVPVILFDDFTTDKKFVDFPFKVKSSAIKILKPKGQNNLKFIFELMNNTKFTFTEHKRYYISTYKNIAIYATKNKQEQQKIAECLSSIDDLISAQAEKIEALKQHKKGLLQGLFPSIEEVENE